MRMNQKTMGRIMTGWLVGAKQEENHKPRMTGVKVQKMRWACPGNKGQALFITSWG
jgi:hypothetical protein